ncbi:MAG: trypsin-like peptidase domain-containing protein [Phycisphaerae bacterium]
MRLDSARELKTSLLTAMLAAAAEGMGGVPGLSLWAAASLLSGDRPAGAAGRRVERALAAVCRGTFRPGLALGVTQSAGRDYKLAVRLQAGTPVYESIVELARTRARGEVDVRYVGPVRKLNRRGIRRLQSVRRPLVVGCSVGRGRQPEASRYQASLPEAGTLGCFVRFEHDPAPLLLCNNHVLADENQAAVGDAVVQPGRLDATTAKSRSTKGGRVALLAEWVELDAAGVNAVDCAVARIDAGIDVDPDTLAGHAGTFARRHAEPQLGEEVTKVGRSTGTTRGRVSTIELDNLFVDYDLGRLRFDRQIEIESLDARGFSEGGDSGAVVLNRQREAVGLLFAGSETGGGHGGGLTYANPLDLVLNTLQVRML